MSRRDGLVLVGLLTVQMVLLVGVFVSSPHPGGDNAGYVALAHALESGQGYTEVWDPARPPHTKYPPVFPALLALAMAAGAAGWGGLKLVPMAAGLVAVAATFLWARRRLDAGPAAAVALLTGLSPALLYHAHWLLSDVPFLAFLLLGLWLLDHGGPQVGSPPAREDEAAPNRTSRLRLAVGIGCVILACLTRSAGLPLAASVVGAWVLAGRYRQALAGGSLLALPVVAWFIRSRLAGPGEGRYGSEFFLLDPYQPDRGRAGVGDFAARIGENLTGYVGQYLPEALLGRGGGAAALLTGALLLLALVGWWVGVRRRAGPAELFVPLYTGVILVWPTVWSGDRFALPLIPLVLVFAALGLSAILARIQRTSWTVTAGTAVWLLAALFAGGDWLERRDEAARCRGAVAAAGPWACGGGPLVDFVSTARWAGESLPDDAVALTRKPRIWYAMSGVATRTYPFTREPGVLLDEAGAAGADYVVLDFVGSQGTRFVGAAIMDAPERFCQVGAFGGGQGVPATRLLRVGEAGLDLGSRVVDGQLALATCLDGPEVAVPRRAPTEADTEIPILR